MNQKRFVNVFLDYIGSFWSFLLWFSDNVDYIIHCLGNLNSLSTISIFSWLDDPEFSNTFIVLFEISPFFITIVTNMDMKSDR